MHFEGISSIKIIIESIETQEESLSEILMIRIQWRNTAVKKSLSSNNNNIKKRLTRLLEIQYTFFYIYKSMGYVCNKELYVTP